MGKNESTIKSWKYIFYLGLGSSLTVLSLLVLSIWHTSDRIFATLTNLFKPQSPTLEIDNSAIILEKIQGIQELTTTVYRMETIVPTSAERVFGENWVIGKTELLYVAHGEVKAGIDLNKLELEDIKVNKDKIAIAIPASEILDSKIDVNASHIYHYDRGFLNLGPDVAPQLQTLAQQKTLNKIVTTACNQGILKEADVKAKETIVQLLTMTSNKAIEVSVDRDLSNLQDISCLKKEGNIDKNV